MPERIQELLAAVERGEGDGERVMNDILERLLSWKTSDEVIVGNNTALFQLQEAAIEIARLRAANTELLEALRQIVGTADTTVSLAPGGGS